MAFKNIYNSPTEYSAYTAEMLASHPELKDSPAQKQYDAVVALVFQAGGKLQTTATGLQAVDDKNHPLEVANNALAALSKVAGKDNWHSLEEFRKTAERPNPTTEQKAAIEKFEAMAKQVFDKQGVLQLELKTDPQGKVYEEYVARDANNAPMTELSKQMNDFLRNPTQAPAQAPAQTPAQTPAGSLTEEAKTEYAKAEKFISEKAAAGSTKVKDAWAKVSAFIAKEKAAGEKLAFKEDGSINFAALKDKAGQEGKDALDFLEKNGELAVSKMPDPVKKNGKGIIGAILGAVLGGMMGGGVGAIIGLIVMALVGSYMDGKDGLLQSFLNPAPTPTPKTEEPKVEPQAGKGKEKQPPGGPAAAPPSQAPAPPAQEPAAKQRLILVDAKPETPPHVAAALPPQDKSLLDQIKAQAAKDRQAMLNPDADKTLEDYIRLANLAPGVTPDPQRPPVVAAIVNQPVTTVDIRPGTKQIEFTVDQNGNLLPPDKSAVGAMIMHGTVAGDTLKIDRIAMADKDGVFRISPKPSGGYDFHDAPKKVQENLLAITDGKLDLKSSEFKAVLETSQISERHQAEKLVRIAKADAERARIAQEQDLAKKRVEELEGLKIVPKISVEQLSSSADKDSQIVTLRADFVTEKGAEAKLVAYGTMTKDGKFNIDRVATLGEDGKPQSPIALKESIQLPVDKQGNVQVDKIENKVSGVPNGAGGFVPMLDIHPVVTSLGKISDKVDERIAAAGSQPITPLAGGPPKTEHPTRQL